MAPAEFSGILDMAAVNAYILLKFKNVNQGIHRKITIKKCLDYSSLHLATPLLNSRLTKMSLKTSLHGGITTILNVPSAVRNYKPVRYDVRKRVFYVPEKKIRKPCLVAPCVRSQHATSIARTCAASALDKNNSSYHYFILL